MAEKKATKAAATKAAKKEAAVEAPKAKKACATKKACAPKKEVAPKAAAKKEAPKKAAQSIIYVNSENAGFKAGDVYQALAATAAAMTPEEIAKQAKCTVEEVYLGMGWLLKEGKITTDAENKVVLA